MITEKVISTMDNLLTTYNGVLSTDEEFSKKIDLMCECANDSLEKQCYREVQRHIINKSKIRDGEKQLLLRVKRKIDAAIAQIPDEVTDELAGKFLTEVVEPAYQEEINRWESTPLNGLCRKLMYIYQQEVWSVWNSKVKSNS